MTREAAKPRLDDALFAACGLAWGAGVIHLQAAIAHLDEAALHSVLFTLVACAQFLWGIALYRSPQARLLWAGAAGSLGVVAVWIMSRTSGLPIGPDPWVAERAGALDLIASADEVALALVAILHLRGRRIPGLVTAVMLGLILLSALTPTFGAHVH